LEIPDDRSGIEVFNVQLALDLLEPDPTQVELRVDRRNLREPTSLATCPELDTDAAPGTADASAADRERSR